MLLMFWRGLQKETKKSLTFTNDGYLSHRVNGLSMKSTESDKFLTAENDSYVPTYIRFHSKFKFPILDFQASITYLSDYQSCCIKMHSPIESVLQ